ncbi:hypothetical protein XAC217_490004 [Xanthomonas citri pv. citri]|nr:hypothetical protein XAC217_490004 [Xanthomonas citri pv. citri]
MRAAAASIALSCTSMGWMS